MGRSFYLDKEKCTGCTNCMRKCPTEAIRIVDGKAETNMDKCIHCGECIKICPYNAYYPKCDKLSDIEDYDYTIVIPSTSVYGQFYLGTEICKVHKALLSLGFDYVYDESWAAELTTMAIKEKLQKGNFNKPMLSSNCPAVSKLIKVKYPALADNIIDIEIPMEIAAVLAKKRVKDMVNPGAKIGVYYISPCPAKILNIKNPLSGKESNIDKVISFKEIYGELFKEIRIRNEKCFSNPSFKGLKWVIAGGQCQACEIENSISVSGIFNVVEILEEIESGKLSNIDFIELMSCNESCIGGPFNFENAFVAKNNINYLFKALDESLISNPDINKYNDLVNEGYMLSKVEVENENTKVNIKEAVIRLEKVKNIYNVLPKIDCGSCGAPNCMALAEDIADGTKTFKDCVILEINKIQEGK